MLTVGSVYLSRLAMCIPSITPTATLLFTLFIGGGVLIIRACYRLHSIHLQGCAYRYIYARSIAVFSQMLKHLRNPLHRYKLITRHAQPAELHFFNYTSVY